MSVLLVEVQVTTTPQLDVTIQTAPPTFTVVSMLPTGPMGPQGPPGTSIPVSATAPPDPEVNDLWVDIS